MKHAAFVILALLALASCTKKEGDTTQTIITSDSSDITGRLYVEAYDLNGSRINNAKASLFLSYNDLVNNISLYTITSNSSGRIDFGYVLEGNYYITGVSGDGMLHDTTVAQVLPRRVISRKLFLR